MSSHDSDDSDRTITQARQDKIIEPFYKYWRIMANHRTSISGDATKPSEQEIEAARKDFEEALAAEHGELLSKYKDYTKDEDYLQCFGDNAEVLLMDIAAELDLSWEDLKTNVFEPAKYDMDKLRSSQPLYGGLRKAARSRWKKREAENTTISSASQTSGTN